MAERAIINVIDELTSTSITDALSANMGRVLNEKLMVRDISGMNLNTLVGELIIGYGNQCTNKPTNGGNGYFLNLNHPTAPTTYNKQFWANRVYSQIYTRCMENGVWSEWEAI